MQVAHPEQQHQVMIEAVENHMPTVLVIDEIGTEAECHAARTIAQRGVMLVATAHGEAAGGGGTGCAARCVCLVCPALPTTSLHCTHHCATRAPPQATCWRMC